MYLFVAVFAKQKRLRLSFKPFGTGVRRTKTVPQPGTR